MHVTGGLKTSKVEQKKSSKRKKVSTSWKKTRALGIGIEPQGKSFHNQAHRISLERQSQSINVLQTNQN